jgi:hypothetical protein
MTEYRSIEAMSNQKRQIRQELQPKTGCESHIVRPEANRHRNDAVQFKITSHFDRRSNTDSAESRQPTSKPILTRFAHTAKQEGEIASTEDGIQIDRSDAQRPNADSPRLEILEPGSNVKFERDLQPKKQESRIVSTDEGIQIDSSD